MMNVIGLAGQAGAGKDYVCDLIRSNFDKQNAWATRVAFADGVRNDIEIAMGAEPGSIEALWSKPYPLEIRALLQWWGTEFRRAQDTDFWAKRGLEAAQWEFDLGGADLIIFTDVRFENEAVAIRDAGGMVFEVVADEAIREERLGGVLPPAHASEDIDFEVDGFVHNSGTTTYPSALTEYLDGIL